MVGIELGEVVHVFAVAFGLSALLAASAEALDVLRYGGAAYLVVLGVRRWREGAREIEGEAPPASPRRIMAQGFVVQLLNPKVAIFFLAFFPQFLNPDAAVLPQTLALGALYVAIAACSTSPTCCSRRRSRAASSAARRPAAAPRAAAG